MNSEPILKEECLTLGTHREIRLQHPKEIIRKLRGNVYKQMYIVVLLIKITFKICVLTKVYSIHSVEYYAPF